MHDPRHRAPSVLAHRCDWEGETIVAVHELAGEPAEITLAVAGAGAGLRAVDLLCEGTTEVGNDGLLSLELAPYGCRWLRVVRPGDRYII